MNNAFLRNSCVSWLAWKAFGTFSEVREVGRSVRGRAGVTRGKFWKILGLPRRVPVYLKWTDRSSQVSKVSVLRVPVYQKWTDRSLLKQKSFCCACTGLPEMDRPVFNEQRWGICCVYRSTEKLKTSLFNPVRWISSRVPVYAKVEDRSSPVIR